MAEIKWTSGYSVGVPLMDEQHKRLIDLINTTGGPGDERTTAEAIRQMELYAELHFKAEEEMLREKNYPELPFQIEEHRRFFQKTDEFAAKDLADPAVRGHLHSFLCRWLSHHILEVDMKYKHFLLPVS
ncbi:MAG: bacteriohemerythrin [Kiritimatiellia bacterium]